MSQIDDARPCLQSDSPATDEAGKRHSRILLIGDDPALQYSRRKVLESAGYAVTSANSALTVEKLFLRDTELVLLCHAIPENVAAHIVTALMRLAPHVPVAQISPLGTSSLNPATAPQVPARPAELLGAVSARLAHH